MGIPDFTTSGAAKSGAPPPTVARLRWKSTDGSLVACGRVRIGIATCVHPPARDDDLDFLLPALRRRGSRPRRRPGGSEDRLEPFDLVLISSTWDYDSQPADFRQVAEEDREGDPAAEPVGDRELEHGQALPARARERPASPTIPTIWTEPGSEDEIEATVAELGWSDIILKPVVDLGAQRLARVETPMVGRHPAVACGAGMAQPFMASVQTEGELSLVFIGGELTPHDPQAARAGRLPGSVPVRGPGRSRRRAGAGARHRRHRDRCRPGRDADLRARRHASRRSRRAARDRARIDRAEPVPGRDRRRRPSSLGSCSPT